MNQELGREIPEQDFEAEQEDIIAEALDDAGLPAMKTIKPGTDGYIRLLGAAKSYMQEAKKAELVSAPLSLTSGYSDRDDYFRPKPDGVPDAVLKASSSDDARRQHHDTMAMMIFGKKRKELTQFEADQLSNFAAYVTGDLEYIDSWSV